MCLKLLFIKTILPITRILKMARIFRRRCIAPESAILINPNPLITPYHNPCAFVLILSVVFIFLIGIAIFTKHKTLFTMDKQMKLKLIILQV